ncbi:ArsR/SmtB family transcription factor [Halostella salina]|uniref:ArsR/SmtB family transcription factor n=1 Tax=Halostella salina TaxID=1547897 RepID=UPI000EF81243|nr:winged helix-turn-helix domain-containing protein [Halostella salina]
MGLTDDQLGADTDIGAALGSLGNDNRLQILLTLAEAERTQREQWLTRSFTELYEAVDIGSTSQFSYHLRKLVGQFVTETPEGYQLTYSGRKIVRAVRSGVYESSPSFERQEVDGVCVLCEAASLVATLESEQFTIRCTACDSTLITDYFPRSQARNRSPGEIVDSFGHRIWGTYVQVRGNVCPECFGPVETGIETHERGDKTLHTYTSACPQCWFTVHIPVEAAVAFHPAAMGAFWDAGVALPTTPLWELWEYTVGDVITTETVASDPIELEVTVTLDDITLRFSIDGANGSAPVLRTAE